MKRIGQIRKAVMLAGLACLVMAEMAQAVIEKCRDMYGQYPYFFMLPVYLGKVEVSKNETHKFKTSGDCFRSIVITTTFTIDKPAEGK